MYNNFTNELFESLLELAVYESSLSETADYSDSEIEKITLSDTCDIKIKKMGRRVKITLFLKTSFHSLGKAAAAICIVLGISFSALLLNSEVRAACYNAVITFYEKYVEILIHPSANNKDTNISAGFIPEGYELTDTDTNEYMSTLIFYNAEGKRLFIQYNQINANQQADI